MLGYPTIYQAIRLTESEECILDRLRSQINKTPAVFVASLKNQIAENPLFVMKLALYYSQIFDYCTTHEKLKGDFISRLGMPTEDEKKHYRALKRLLQKPEVATTDHHEAIRYISENLTAKSAIKLALLCPWLKALYFEESHITGCYVLNPSYKTKTVFDTLNFMGDDKKRYTLISNLIASKKTAAAIAELLKTHPVTVLKFALRNPDIEKICRQRCFADFWNEYLQKYCPFSVDNGIFTMKMRPDLNPFSQAMAYFSYREAKPWRCLNSSAEETNPYEQQWLSIARRYHSYHARYHEVTKYEHAYLIDKTHTLRKEELQMIYSRATIIAKKHGVPGVLLLAYTLRDLGEYFTFHGEHKTAREYYTLCLENVYFAWHLERLSKTMHHGKKLFPFMETAIENAFFGESLTEGNPYKYSSFEAAIVDIRNTFYISKEEETTAQNGAKRHYHSLIAGMIKHYGLLKQQRKIHREERSTTEIDHPLRLRESSETTKMTRTKKATEEIETTPPLKKTCVLL